MNNPLFFFSESRHLFRVLCTKYGDQVGKALHNCAFHALQKRFHCLFREDVVKSNLMGFSLQELTLNVGNKQTKFNQFPAHSTASVR